MLKRLSNKLMMYQGVHSHLLKNKLIWESVPAMVLTIGDFEVLLSEINKYQQRILGNNKGITLHKAELQTLVIGHTYEIMSMLYAMAIRKNDSVLAAKVNYTKTDLVGQRDDLLVIICREITDLARKNLAELVAYQVSEEELRVLGEEIERFAACLNIGQVSGSQKKAANALLKDLFVQVDALLKKQLDRMMVRYEKSHATFYQIYKDLRRIINYGVRHEKPKEPEKEA